MPARYAFIATGNLASMSTSNDGSGTMITSRSESPMTIATPLTAAPKTGPLPTCPYALPADTDKSPRPDNVVARPAANAPDLAANELARPATPPGPTTSPFVRSVSLPVSNPPIYPSVSGNTESVQGEKLVTTPVASTRGTSATLLSPASTRPCDTSASNDVTMSYPAFATTAARGPTRDRPTAANCLFIGAHDEPARAQEA
mmetsp:Transcript_15343/g.43744  ORF Transcript_15343/g.43744 Transcript_15343/m.43744 type:complete len:202 (-) Transcript_15343:109-714(-)